MILEHQHCPNTFNYIPPLLKILHCLVDFSLALGHEIKETLKQLLLARADNGGARYFNSGVNNTEVQSKVPNNKTPLDLLQCFSPLLTSLNSVVLHQCNLSVMKSADKKCAHTLISV